MIITRDAFRSIFGWPVGPIPASGQYTCGDNLAVLLALAAFKRPRQLLELYTAKGHTALALARLCPYAEVVTFDLSSRAGIPEGQRQSDEVLPPTQIGMAFNGRPEVTNITFELIDPATFDFHRRGPFDLVYVDGWHAYEGVRRDTRIALDAAADNALIVWDDYKPEEPGVMQMVNELNRSTGDCITLVAPTHICFCFLTKPRKEALRRVLG